MFTFCEHFLYSYIYSSSTLFSQHKTKICLCQATKQCLLLNRTPGLHISLDIQLPDFLVEYEHLTTPLWRNLLFFFQLVSKLFCRRFLCRDWSGDLINIIWFCLEHLSLFIFHVTFNQGQLKALTWSWKTEQFCYRKYFCAFTLISLAIKDESPSQKAKKKNVYIGL